MRASLLEGSVSNFSRSKIGSLGSPIAVKRGPMALCHSQNSLSLQFCDGDICKHVKITIAMASRFAQTTWVNSSAKGVLEELENIKSKGSEIEKRKFNVRSGQEGHLGH